MDLHHLLLARLPAHSAELPDSNGCLASRVGATPEQQGRVAEMPSPTATPGDGQDQSAAPPQQHRSAPQPDRSVYSSDRLPNGLSKSQSSAASSPSDSKT